MKDFNKKDLFKVFKKIGIQKGDSLFLTTNLGVLGRPETKNKNYLLTTSKWILNNLQKIIGNNGNIFVPTYSYSFAKNRHFFDPKKTKANIGYFPNYFLRQKNITRSIDPMMSISGLGPKVKKILCKPYKESFGKDCVFERLLKIKNLKCCNIGLGYNWMPFIHYLDWLNKTPFRFNKLFKGFVKIENNKKFIKWVYFARHVRKETISNGYKIGLEAKKKKLFIKSKIGKSIIYIINYNSYFKFAKKLTKTNKWLTVNGPKF